MSDGQRKVKVTISPIGVPTIEAVNFQGINCTEATKGLEQALAGGGEMTREFKPEWAGSTSEGQEVEQHQTW